MAIGDKLYVADKPTLDSVNTKVGSTGDVASASGSIFARFTELLVNRLTAVRAGKLDNLDALISSRAAASTALSNAVWTNTRAGYLDYLLGLSAGIVKSVQRGILAGAGYVTINTLNTNKTMVYSISKGSAGYVAARGTITLSPDIANFMTTKPTSGGVSTNAQSNSFPSYNGSISGGSTDLTVKEYSATLVNATTIYCDGPCEWQVIEYV